MDFRELMAYKKAYELSMEIYTFSKLFPKDEKYSLTDQIRRSSRSVCANIADAYRKRRYVNHSISKLTDSDAEIPKQMFGWSLHYDVNTFLKSNIFNSQQKIWRLAKS